jgi:hypothetical protein
MKVILKTSRFESWVYDNGRAFEYARDHEQSYDIPMCVCVRVFLFVKKIKM